MAHPLFHTQKVWPTPPFFSSQPPILYDQSLIPFILFIYSLMFSFNYLFIFYSSFIHPFLQSVSHYSFIHFLFHLFNLFNHFLIHSFIYLYLLFLGKDSHSFSAGHHTYILYFDKMFQRNTKFLTERNVTRRPEFVAKDQMKEIAQKYV